MIVDVHTYIWETPHQMGPATPERLRRTRTEPWERPDAGRASHAEAMEPVDHAIIHGLECRAAGALIPHEQVAERVAENPEKYIGFAGIDPLGPAPQESLQRARSLGLMGVTLSPAACGFHPCHSKAMQLFEVCQDQSLPVMVVPGIVLGSQSHMEFARPELLDEVARTFPKLRMVVGHLGYPWIDATLLLITKHPNLYADTAGLVGRPFSLYEALVKTYELGVGDRVLFGSGFPWCSPRQAVLNVYGLNTIKQMPQVPRRELRNIVEADALAILGLHRDGGNGQVGEQPSDQDSITGSLGHSTTYHKEGSI